MSKLRPLMVTITWRPGDVQTLRPKWSLTRCAAALDRVGKGLQDRSIEVGWDILETLLVEDK